MTCPRLSLPLLQALAGLSLFAAGSVMAQGASGTAAPAPAVAPAPAAAPERAAPGALIVTADADGLVAEVAGTVKGLTKGDNRFDLPSGTLRVVIKGKDGKVLHDAEATIPAAGEARVAVASIGKIDVKAGTDAKVELDGKALAGKDGRFTAEAEPGARSLVVKRPGHVGRKGVVAVEAGKTASVDANLQAWSSPDTNQTGAWVAILGGGALILTAVAIDALGSFDDVGGDATRWAFLGIGTAGFVTGTIALKSKLAAAAAPPVEDGTFDVRVGGGRSGAGVQLAWRFR